MNNFAGTFLWSVYANVPEVSLMLNIATAGPGTAIASEGIAGYNFMWGQVHPPRPPFTSNSKALHFMLHRSKTLHDDWRLSALAQWWSLTSASAQFDDFAPVADF